MHYIFFGSPRFAEIVLDKLITNGFIPTALVCNPDRPVGRKKIITPPATKQLVERLITIDKQSINVEILQPETIDQSFLNRLRQLKADFFIVAAYAKILPKELLDIPFRGVIGVHPSLLPKYRGSSPIQSVLLSGKEETGVSLYLMDEKMDHGPVLKTDNLEIKNQNYLELEKDLAWLGGDMLVEMLPRFIRGEITPIPQNESEATYTHKFNTEDALIDLGDLKIAESGDVDKTVKILGMIKAFNPEPGAYIILDGKRIKLLDAINEDGRLKLLKIQEEGKKPRAI
ncbi:MAG TPA: methionyl-tRNA formyltransferase [Candidatus Paceibacterota bacterium]